MFEALEIEPERFSALLILAPSVRSTWNPLSLSEAELLPLSVGVISVEAVCIIRSEERFTAFDASMSRNGEVSLSEDDRFVILGGGGDPPDFFERKPA